MCVSRSKQEVARLVHVKWDYVYKETLAGELDKVCSLLLQANIGRWVIHVPDLIVVNSPSCCALCDIYHLFRPHIDQCVGCPLGACDTDDSLYRQILAALISRCPDRALLLIKELLDVVDDWCSVELEEAQQC